MEQINTISESPENGVFFIIIDDFNDDKDIDSIKEFKQGLQESENVTFFDSEGSQLYKDYEGEEIAISFDNKAGEFQERIVEEERARAERLAKPNWLTYEEIKEDKEIITNGKIKIPFAQDSDENKHHIQFSDSGRVAYIISGKAGSGKTKLFDNIIINAGEKYSPDEVIFQYLDFKDALSSNLYAKEGRVPHMKAVLAGGGVDEASIVVNNLKIEIAQRSEMFKQEDVLKISDYNKKISVFTSLFISAIVSDSNFNNTFGI